MASASSLNNGDTPKNQNEIHIFHGEDEAHIPEHTTALKVAFGVTEILHEAFVDLHRLQYLELSQSVIRIDNGALALKPFLTHLCLPSKLKVIDTEAFAESGLTDLQIPDSVREIGRCAFENCYALSSIRFPPQARMMPEMCIRCYHLQSVELPMGVSVIPSRTFRQCKSLEQILLPDSVLRIEEGAFSCCESLKQVRVSQHLQIIGKSAFWGCKSLKTMNLPDALESIHDRAFMGCIRLKRLRLPNNKAFRVETLRFLAYCPSLFLLERPPMLRSSDWNRIIKGANCYNKGFKTVRIQSNTGQRSLPQQTPVFLWPYVFRQLNKQAWHLCRDMNSRTEDLGHCTTNSLSYDLIRQNVHEMLSSGSYDR